MGFLSGRVTEISRFGRLFGLDFRVNLINGSGVWENSVCSYYSIKPLSFLFRKFSNPFLFLEKSFLFSMMLNILKLILININYIICELL